MTEQVTLKTKNEGRVAAGKRLVEWNRKNKSNLLNNKDQEPTNAESSDLSSSQQEPTSHASSARYCGGAAIVLGIVIALYFYQRKKPALAPATTKVDDIFCMK